MFVGAASVPAPTPTLGAAAAPAVPQALGEESRRFAVTLQRVPVAHADQLKPVPSALERYQVFTTNSLVDGVATIDVNVGYFASREQAEAVRQGVLARFPQATVVDLSERREDALRAAGGQRSPAATAAAERPRPRHRAQLRRPHPCRRRSCLRHRRHLPSRPHRLRRVRR